MGGEPMVILCNPPAAGNPIQSDDTEQQYRRLLASVLLRAVKDADSRNAANRAAAQAWLESGGADCVCEWLDIQPGRLRYLAWRGRQRDKT